MRRWRHGGVVAGWVVIATMVTVGSMMLGTLRGIQRRSEPAVETGGALAGLGPVFAFAPVSPRILSDLIGPAAARRLFGPPRSSRTRSGDNPTKPPGSPSRPPGLTEQLTGSPDLRVTLSVDKQTARAADTLTYTIVVGNVGRGVARRITISAHVPAHTRFLTDDTCGDQPVAVRPTADASQILCYGMRIDDPTRPDQQQDYSVGQAMLQPGKSVRRVFTVLIDAQTPAGTKIANRASVQLAGGATVNSEKVETVVA